MFGRLFLGGFHWPHALADDGSGAVVALIPDQAGSGDLAMATPATAALLVGNVTEMAIRLPVPSNILTL